MQLVTGYYIQILNTDLVRRIGLVLPGVSEENTFPNVLWLTWLKTVKTSFSIAN